MGEAHLAIYVDKLPWLLERLKDHFEKWVASGPTYESQYVGDPRVGQKVVWDGFSNPVQYFLKKYFEENRRELLFEPEFEDCFSKSKADMSVSYMCSEQKLESMAGERFSNVFENKCGSTTPHNKPFRKTMVYLPPLIKPFNKQEENGGWWIKQVVSSPDEPSRPNVEVKLYSSMCWWFLNPRWKRTPLLRKQNPSTTLIP